MASWKGVIHWTAGGYEPDALDLKSYNFLVNPLGGVIQAVPVDAQIPETPTAFYHPYAAHTSRANGYCFGVSMLGMRGAKPGAIGDKPLTLKHWDGCVQLTAQVCILKGIQQATRGNLVGHCEVEKLWGLNQLGKWDPWYPMPEWKPRIGTAKDPFAIGDIFRSEVNGAMRVLRAS